MTEAELIAIEEHVAFRLADAKQYEVGVVCLDMPVVEQLPALFAEVRKLREAVLHYCPLPSQVFSLQGMAHDMVVGYLKQCGIDPYSKRGVKLMGDPADWTEDIDECITSTLDKAGFKVFAEDWEDEYKFRESLGLNRDGTPKDTAALQEEVPHAE